MNVQAIKHAVRQRDSFKCVQCGITAEQHIARYGRTLDVHRLVPGSVYRAEECQTLCRKCHGPRARRKRGTPDLGRRLQPLCCSLKPRLFAALQRYLASRRPAPSLSGVLNVALDDFLRTEGYWPPAPATK